MGRDFKEDILKTVSQFGNNGATITEIEKIVRLERHTLSKYLFILNKEGFLKYKPVGKAKVWFINTMPLQTLFTSLPENRSFTEKLLSDILSKIPVGVMVIDNDYNILFMNDILTQKYGNLESQKFYKTILSMQNPLRLKEINNMIDNFSKSAEVQLTDKDDNILDIKASKLINPDKSHSVILIIEDVTLKKKAEDKIRQSEAKYIDLFMNAPIGYHSIGHDGKFIDINNEELHMLGYKREELIGKKSLTDIIIPEDKDKFHIHMTMLHKGKPVKDFEYTYVKKNRQNIYIRLNATPKLDKFGKFVSSRASVEDITEQKIAQTQLEDTNKQLSDFKFALDEASDVTITDKNGIIIYANDTFCKISKYSRDELIGKTHQIVNSGYHSKEFFQDMWKTISSGKVWHGNVKNKSKEGKIHWMKTTIVPFLDSNGKPYQYIAIRTDITDSKN